MAPKPKKPTVKITGTVSSSGGKAGTKSVTRGASIFQSPKIVDSKPAAKKAKTTVYKPKPTTLTSKATKAAGKVVSRAKTVAREVRDIPTAVGTVARATAAGKSNKGFRADGARYYLKEQVKEVKTAAQSGKKGTRAFRYSSVNPNKNR